MNQEEQAHDSQADAADNSRADAPPELVLGLIGAVGTDLAFLTEQLSDQLRINNYTSELIRLSALLRAVPGWQLPSENAPRDKYIHMYQDRGDELRRRTRSGGALAQLAMRRIAQLRLAAAAALPKPAHEPDDSAEKDPPQVRFDLGGLGAHEIPTLALFNPPLHRTAFILRSLKHPDEASVLRNVYGDRCVLIAAHLPRDEAIDSLALEIARTKDQEKGEKHTTRATEIYEREADPDRDVPAAEQEKRSVADDELNEFGQNVRDVYQVADYFVDASNRDTIADDVKRLVKLIFRAPFETPRREEVAMSIASAVSASSSAMGRQVGAAIIGRARGEVLAVGTNEVPRAGGGQYWASDVPDGRDFAFGDHADSSVMIRRSIVNEVITLLNRASVIPNTKDGEQMPVEELLKALRTARLSKLVEFGRPVHAELMAITDAARRGAALEDTLLVCTTYPCHACARHIVAAGINEVIYIEPYAKSLAQNLHSDAIVRDRRRQGDDRVLFRQFLGVAPTRYEAFFRRSGSERRDQHGVARKYVPRRARPRVNDNFAYLYSEWAAVQAIEAAMRREGLASSDEDPEGTRVPDYRKD